MDITYLGGSAFLLRGRDASLLTDPGSVAPSVTLPDTQVVTVSGEEAARPGRETEGPGPRAISRPGEYEVSGILVRGVSTRKESQGGRHVAYMMTIDGVTLCHLGRLNRVLTSAEAGELSDAEVLFLPIGGDPAATLSVSAATEVVGLLSPKIVVPMLYEGPAMAASEGDEEAPAAVSPVLAPFLKELGVRGETTPQNRLSVTPTNQPSELQVVLLQPRTRA